MLKRIAFFAAAVVSFALSLFFVVIVASLVASEVMPAVANGSLNVATSTMILNIRWDGNEIYILLALYVGLAMALAWAGARMLRRGLNRPA